MLNLFSLVGLIRKERHLVLALILPLVEHVTLETFFGSLRAVLGTACSVKVSTHQRSTIG